MTTHIEWTDEVWNPAVGCDPVSEGCRNCYAAKEALRLAGNPHPAISALYEGTSEMRGVGDGRRAVFTGVVRTAPDRLDQPLRWRKPRRIFVNSMSDLFHEDISDDYIDRVFATMSMSPRHTFQVLTKRPERMHAYFSNDELPKRIGLTGLGMLMEATQNGEHWAQVFDDTILIGGEGRLEGSLLQWPLKNVWIGVSCEDQPAADARIPFLLATPAAVRFVSLEPLLGPIDISNVGLRWPEGFNPSPTNNRLDWVIVGLESGPGARAGEVAWARALLDECRHAAVAVFMKQVGARPVVPNDSLDKWPLRANGEDVRYVDEPGRTMCQGDLIELDLVDRKGGDWSEWPEDLRVREFPAAA